MNRPNGLSKGDGDAQPCSWFSEDGLAHEPNPVANGRDDIPQKISQIGPYQLQEKLGRGGMGVVYKAIHLKLKRTVAIKILLPELTRNSQAIARFEREIEAVGKLDHPNIVRATDADEGDGTHYLVMEYVDGCNLSELVRRSGPLAVSDACELIRQAAIGLQHAHEAGLVHRDVKPSNLMLATDGLVKLLDLGLAILQHSDGDRELTATGAAMGTVDYMSPEQAMNTKNADRRADVYSLGATLWYLLTGRELYEGNSALEKLMAHQGKPIPSLRDVRPDIPPALDSLFMRMMAKTPESRIQTMAEVAVALEGCRASDASAPSKYTAPNAGSRLHICIPGANPTPGPILATSTAARSCLPLATEEATQVPQMSQTETDPETERLSVRPATSPMVTNKSTRTLRRQVFRTPPKWPLAAYAAGAAGAAALLLAGIVLWIPTKHGVMRIEINDPQIEVLVDGQGATIKGAKPHEIKLEPGQHSLRIKYGPLDFETDKFILSRDDAVTLKVELLPGQVQVVKGDTSLGARPLPAIAPFKAQQARAYQEACAKHLGVPVEFTNTIGMKFQLIPPGEFTMGMSKEEAEAVAAQMGERFKHLSLSSAPAHRVRLTQAFYLGTYEVTQAQYERVTGSNPAHFSATGPGKDVVANEHPRQHPVEMVSYIDAAEFCIKLNKKEQFQPVYSSENNVITLLPGDGYRLPTEAEWEWACRAGTTTLWSHGEQGSELGTVAWYGAGQRGRTHAVGQLKANPFGLHDMHGNVWEWCQDWYDAQVYMQRGPGLTADPQGPDAGSANVLRGGGWHNGSPYCCCAFRVASDVGGRSHVCGFRVMVGVDAVKAAIEKRNTKSAKAPTSGTANAPPLAIAPFNAEQAKQHQKAWAKHLGVPVEFTNTIGMKFQLIPPGEFTMGMSRAEAEATAALSPLNEQWQALSLSSAPAHRVRLTRANYLGTYEVTQEQYEKVTGNNPAYFSATGPGKDSVANENPRQHPVETVSYIDAAEFCIKLNKRELLPPVYSNENNLVTLLPGDGYRLPTEAEWEGACRAGTTSLWFHGDQSSSLEAVAWWMRNSKGMTHPVGQLRGNPFGLHDIHGNVSEWCQDAYDAQAYGQRGAGPAEDPRGLETESARVVRGGNWRDGIASSRSALRVAADVDYRRPHVGFRVVLGVDAIRQALKATAPPMPKSQTQ